nr:unnamed protein product [Callosobruchus analis]
MTRLCVDYHWQSKMILAKLSGSKYSTKLDTNSGFHQIKLSPDSQLLTTFITRCGRYFFKHLPFGINCAPEYFALKTEFLGKNKFEQNQYPVLQKIKKFIHEGWPVKDKLTLETTPYYQYLYSFFIEPHKIFGMVNCSVDSNREFSKKLPTMCGT